MLSTKFRVNWPFTSGEEAKNKFQDGHHKKKEKKKRNLNKFHWCMTQLIFGELQPKGPSWSRN